MIDHAKRLREIHEWLADPTDFAMVKRTAFEAADEIDRLKARVAELEGGREPILPQYRHIPTCPKCGATHPTRSGVDNWCVGCGFIWRAGP